MTNDALRALEKIKSDVDGLFPKHTHGERFETIRAALAPVDVDAIHQDGFDEGFESGKLEATEFDRDLRRAVFGFLEKRGQIENGEEYTAQDIMDCLVAYEHYLINTNKAPKPVDVEGLANYIRTIDGENTMGAGKLAEKLTAALTSPKTDTVSREEYDAVCEDIKRARNALNEYANQPDLSDLIAEVVEALDYGTESLAADCGVRFTTFCDEGYTNDKREKLARCEKALEKLTAALKDKGV